MPAPRSERRLASVLFIDLVEFTAHAEHRDPEDVKELLDGYFAAARSVIDRFDGTLEKFIGDAVMAVWGVPTAHEDDAARAVQAGLELIAAVERYGATAGVALLTARGGVATGEVATTVGARDHGLVAGDVVNTASRLQTNARPGGVLVDAATARAARRRVGFEAAETLTVRNRQRAVTTYRATGLAAGPAVDPGQLQVPFVGRQAELASLLDAVGRARRSPAPLLVLLVGRAGVGKSRLLDELKDRVAGQGRWIELRGEQHGEPHLVLEALESSLSRSLHRRAGRRPVIVAVDDVQWIGPASRAALEKLRRRSASILIVAAGRPDLEAMWAVDPPADLRIELEPLARDALRAALLQLAPGMPRRLLRQLVEASAGIPLYAAEMLRMLVDAGVLVPAGDRLAPGESAEAVAMPESLHALVAARIDALEPALAAVLRDAAVLGNSFRLEALGAVSDLGSGVGESIDALVARGMLVEEAEPPKAPATSRGLNRQTRRYRFADTLARDVAYGGLGRRLRRARHVDAFRYYRSLDEPGLVGLAGEHALAAYRLDTTAPDGPDLRGSASTALREAAEHATRHHAPAQALAYLEEALEVAEADSRGRLHEDAATTAVAVPDAPAAERHSLAAIEWYRDHDDLAALARATSRLGSALLLDYRVQPAIDALAEVLDELRAADELNRNAELAWLGSRLADAYLVTERNDEALTWADRALEAAGALRLPALAATALGTKGSALASLGRREEGLQLMREAISRAESAGVTEGALRARQRLAVALLLDDPAAALEVAQAGISLARLEGLGDQMLRLAGVAVEAALDAGAWDWAQGLIAGFEDEEMPLPDRVDFAGVAAVIAALRGDPAAADRLMPLNDVVADAGDTLAAALLASRMSQVAQISGDPQRALPMARAALAGLRQAGYSTAAREGWVPLGRAALRARDSDALAEAIAGLGTEPGAGRWMTATRDAFRAGLDGLSGRLELARRGYANAETAFRDLRLPLPLALCLIDRSVVLADAESRTAASDAMRLLGAVGATGLSLPAQPAGPRGRPLGARPISARKRDGRAGS